MNHGSTLLLFPMSLAQGEAGRLAVREGAGQITSAHLRETD